MSIYPDRTKSGELTGRYRVEVQKGAMRLRARCGSLSEAKATEAQFLTSLESGQDPPSNAKRRFDPQKSRPQTLKETIHKAEGRLWVGKPTARTNFTRLWAMADILGPEIAVDDITTREVDDLIGALEERGAAPATVNRYLSHLRRFLVWCEERSYRTTKLPKLEWREEPEGRIRWITPEEEDALMLHLRGDIPLLVKVAIQTGMRRGELLSLELGQLTEGWAHLWETKSGSPRSVPLTTESYDSLKWLIANQRMPNAHQLRWEWDQAREAMGLKNDPWFVFHACRHTCATRYVQANVNLRVIQKLMGHKTIQTTLRYAHVNDVMLTDALKTLVACQSTHSRISDGSVTIVPPAAGESDDVLLEVA